MSFSSKAKDEVSRKDFTVIEKAYKIDENREKYKQKVFLRESFLKCASVTDPKSDYHLEFSSESEEEVLKIKSALEAFGLEGRISRRSKYYILYFKDAERIIDILNIVGAHDALMEFENERILKEISENVNRRVNCETANINRTVLASLKQIRDIRLIDEKLGIENIDDSLREIAKLRLKYPEASLSVLAEKIDPPIGKSGANHRIRKIAKIADELRSSSL